ncbi:MAG: CmpA/NrtA family ABC transporter substrate-binding protein [Gammaproteobacteria bacterium]
MTTLKFGFIPLTDCAPLVMAQEMGMFRRHGLEVELVKEVSWANIRDKVATATFDGAQMLATMPIAASLGIAGPATPLVTAMVMSLNGNAITVSNSLYAQMQTLVPETGRVRPCSAAAIQTVIRQQVQSGAPKLRLATVFPTSTHTYELRYWLAASGIDPDRDLDLIVIPPTQMVENLASGNIDGFCVGEPWNSLAINEGLGHSLITKYELWNNSPEKVFGVSHEWAEKNPDDHMATIRALVEAARWLDADIANRHEAAAILSRHEYLNTDIDVIKNSMTGTYQYNAGENPLAMPDFNVFYRYAANFPWLSHAVWFLSQMIRWGHIQQPLDVAAVASHIYRPDIYRQAVTSIGLKLPNVDYKEEGVHAHGWEWPDQELGLKMGADYFFDHARFRASEIITYLDTFSIQHPRFDYHALK